MQLGGIALVNEAIHTTAERTFARVKIDAA
jgi:hypothetical protein